MISKRARRLGIINNQKFTKSAHEILFIIKENMPSCYSYERCFYLKNFDQGTLNAILIIRSFLQAIIDVDALLFVP